MDWHQEILWQLSLLNEKLDAVQQAQSDLGGRLRAVENAVLSSKPIHETRLYSRAEAAQILRVTTRTIDKWARIGRLQIVRRGRSVFLPGRSLISRYEYTENSVAVLKI